MNTGQSHTPPTAAERISAGLLRSHVRTSERLQASRRPEAGPATPEPKPSLLHHEEINQLALSVLKLLHGLRVCDIQAVCTAASRMAA